MFCVVNADMDRITFTGSRLKFLSWSTVTYSYLAEKGQRINLLMSAILFVLCVLLFMFVSNMAVWLLMSK